MRASEIVAVSAAVDAPLWALVAWRRDLGITEIWGALVVTMILRGVFGWHRSRHQRQCRSDGQHHQTGVIIGVAQPQVDERVGQFVHGGRPQKGHVCGCPHGLQCAVSV